MSRAKRKRLVRKIRTKVESAAKQNPSPGKMTMTLSRGARPSVKKERKRLAGKVKDLRKKLGARAATKKILTFKSKARRIPR